MQENSELKINSPRKRYKANLDLKMRSDKRKESMMNGREDMSSNRCLINPNGTFKKVWETFKFILLIYTFIYLPLTVTFFAKDDQTVKSPSWIFDRFIDLVFLIDMVLIFFTPVMDKYDITTEHKSIAKIYLQGWFFVDLVALLPFEDVMDIFID